MTGIGSREDIVGYWDSIRARTMRVAELIPEDRIETVLIAGAMSCGDVLRHLAMTERWMFVEVVCGRPTQYRSHSADIAAGKSEVLKLMRETHAESVAVLASLTPQMLEARIRTPADALIPAWKWLRAMIEHEVHHRGQLYLMLRMLGVTTPPMFGLTSEELRARAGD